MAKKTITVTEADLARAFLSWEHRYRSGGCLPKQEALAVPAEEVARSNAATMFQLLKQPIEV